MRRAYAGILRIVSSASFGSRGGRKPLVTVHLSLRESCPKCCYSSRYRRFTFGRPEGDKVTGLALGHTPQLNAGRRILGDPGHVLNGAPDVVGADRLAGVIDDEPDARPPCRE